MGQCGMTRRPTNPWLVAPVVALAAFMEILDISIANVSLPHIAGNLGATVDESSWILTSYLVMNAIFMPISGWVSTVMGRKRFFLVCIVGFSLASLLCGLAPNLGLLVVMRALQGAAGSGLQPSGQAILSDTFAPQKRGMAFAVYGIAAVFAPAIGPTLGGWITDNLSWRWVFLINVPVGITLFLLITALIEDPPNLLAARASYLKDKIPFDYIGFGLIALGLGALQIVLDRGQEDDWFASHLIVILSAAAVVGLAALVPWVWRRDNAIVDLALLRNRTFAVSSGLMFMLGFILLGSTYVIPAFVQELLGYTATDAGLVITPGALALVVLMPFIGRIVTKVDVRWLIALGLGICGTALLTMAGFNLATDYRHIMLARVFQSLGLGFLFIPINTIAFMDLPRDKTNNASALINLWRNLGGSVGISMVTTLLTRRTQLHHSIMAGYIRQANPALAHTRAALTHYLHHVAGGAAPPSLAVIAQIAQQQARLLSYLDVFKFFGLAFLAMLPSVLLLHKAKTAGGAPAAHLG